ncbi:MAG: 3-isopropylmalate dehydratase large subunit [Rhodospirillaceae bacterium]|nr:3-isopropylmalate dehydratase large subunit [Rhodospirillaceae bacterium]MCY4239014.1 3-isopropylmalate dehydratase large subunit [Rhodospirillaceae bacterium]MCY4311180.1 3-isopropylmalate dehydratase large subunit [Rhodospirillaceae bacterium]
MTRPAQTLAEKLCARAAGQESVEAGKIVTVSVDLAMIHDSGGPRRVAPMLQELGVSVWDPDRIVLVSDHYVPAVDSGTAEILNFTRKWARENGVTAFHDMQGICHVVLPERGHLKPGLFVVGGDSHSTTGGAFGAFMIGIGATEMAGVLATGEIWIKVPPTVRLEWRGALGPGVVAKDMMLAMCAALGMDVGNYKAIEFGGSAVDALDMEARMTLSNMAAELGGKVGLVAPDENTIEWLSAHGVAVESDWLRWRSDDDSLLEARHVFDADVLMPQVAAPHSPANADDVLSFRGTMFHQAYIGACTGAKLTDLHMAAEVLRGRTISNDVRLLVAPASTRTTAAAAADGTLAILTEAGAIMMPSGCGACAGYGAGVLAEGEVCLSSTARNFKGRMGHPTSQVYLASPYTVAASAVAGKIADPREFLLEIAA